MFNFVDYFNTVKVGLSFIDKAEDLKNGGMGFGASSPVMQVAGSQRILETDPKTHFESGNYSNVPIMYVLFFATLHYSPIFVTRLIDYKFILWLRFGGNKQEGAIFLSGQCITFLSHKTKKFIFIY